MKSYTDENFAQFLTSRQIHGFDDLWNLPMELVEEGNIRSRSSRSEVSRWEHVYVKKQQNYLTSLSSWFIARPVCAREFQNICAWRKMGFPTLEPLYFSQEAMGRRAILVTQALEGYQSLESWLAQTQNLAERAKVFARVAELISMVHSKGWYHRCFFPKHVFVNQSNPEQIKLIDLEKARKQWRTSYRDLADIASFFRRCQWLHPKESLHFMKAYWGVTKFETKHRLMLKRLQDRVAAKSK